MLINAGALLRLPRRFAALPLLVGTCYMTLAQGVEIGPFSFSVLRLLLSVGFLRVIIRSERIFGGLNSIDSMMLYWAGWALFSSIFHSDIQNALIFRLGLVYNTIGTYFLLRCFCQSKEDLWTLMRIIPIILMPIAFEMVYEHIRLHNLFSYLGGVPQVPTIREGNVRAGGPFSHPILAGTVGAVCFPFMVPLWSKHRTISIIGITACITIVFASSSSGPLISLMTGLGGLVMWQYRENLRFFRYIAVTGYIALDLSMKAPAYYLMGRIPLVAGSTGWHRAELIHSAILHLNEWWLGGTEYTRHWMPTGVSWNLNHTDITNHYIKLGVIGGLPLLIIFILVLLKAFSLVGQCIKSENNFSSDIKFIAWSLGASLFSNAATMISVSYFDQSYVFLYITLAAIGSAWSIIYESENKNV